jgi:amidohydrolase
VLDDLPPLLEDLRALYEDLHQHPELSFAEHRTAGVLADRLDGLGWAVTTGVGRTGVVATLRSGDGPRVLLRADIDALPVREETGLAYASTATGTDPEGTTVPVAHACGHDMHATWMIGVADLLASHCDRWQGEVVIVMQPAEELGAGADAMVADGLFERFGLPDVALGQHVAPAPAGVVLHRGGTTMAASDAVRMVLHGRGGHGAAPEKTVDPAVMASSTVLKLQTIVARELAPTETAVVTVGSMHVGTKENIISERAELGLSVRTFDPAVRERVLAAIRRIAEGEAASFGAPKPPEVDTLYSFPSLVNDETATATVAEAFRARFGDERSMEGPLVTASEDFGHFATAGGFPSTFWFVGGTDADTWWKALGDGRLDQDVPSNHSPRYAPVQDPTIATGVEAMITAAGCWIGR